MPRGRPKAERATREELLKVNSDLNSDLINIREVIRGKDAVIQQLKEKMHNMAIGRIIGVQTNLAELADELRRAMVLFHESE
jgi:hypothetical protein